MSYRAVSRVARREHVELLDYYGLRETAKTAKTATKLSYVQKYKI
jgi:hypothetical protein